MKASKFSVHGLLKGILFGNRFRSSVNLTFVIAKQDNRVTQKLPFSFGCQRRLESEMVYFR